MLAIVIPYYNLEFFDKTLLSLAQQTNQQFTVYVGDDASPHTPIKLIDAVKDKISISYNRFETNLGSTSLVKHWERCIGLIADEDWIMLLGDDDVLDSKCVEQFYKHLDTIEKQSIQVVRYASQVIDAQDKVISNLFTHPDMEPSTYAFYRKLRKYTRASLSEHIFKKKTYECNGFKDFPLAWHADDLAWLEFTDFKTIYTINDAVVSIRYSNKSISGKQDNLEKKEAARFQFFKILVFKYLRHFTGKQRLAILDEFDLLLPKNSVTYVGGKIWIGYQRFRIQALKFLKTIMPFRNIFKNEHGG